jgi:drug/metabolite transporter (DMT)-like permease
MAFVSSAAPSGGPRHLPVAALIFNAFVWGTSWWPFRRLESHGLHPLWATAMIFVLAALVIAALRPRAVGQVLRTPALWVLIAASGTTNAAFNWGVVIGDVVRVVLLFYLMPLWTVLLARVLLGERFSARALLRVALGLTGAAIVLWPTGAVGLDALPLPRTLADGLGLLGGFTFALNNVMLRREAARPEEGRALAMFVGGALVAGTLAGVLAVRGAVAWPPPVSTAWVGLALGLAAFFLVGNLALQYGAARLPANRTAVVMLTEVLFAAASAVAFGGEVLTWPVLLGGALIAMAAALATPPAVKPVRMPATPQTRPSA